MIQAADTITGPKTTMHQDCMLAVEQAIQDNIVGITPQLAQEHLEYVVHPVTDITLVRYKKKEILRFGFQGNSTEFFIETKGAV